MFDLWQLVGERVLTRGAKARRTRFTPLGPALYVAGAAQYFVIQGIAALRYSPTYSLADNTISDLGNTACASFNGRYACSPAHALMNLSFVALGISTIVGSLLIYHVFRSRRGPGIGLCMFAVGGCGVVLVGGFPENTVSALHGVGAALPFLVGNIGLVVLGATLPVRRGLRLYTLLTGCIAVAALVFYTSGHYLGLGVGGIERVVAYPQTLWQLVFGLNMLVHIPKTDQRRPDGTTLG